MILNPFVRFFAKKEGKVQDVKESNQFSQKAENSKMKILIVTIALGKYTDFLPRFLSTTKDLFVPGVEKEYLIITDKNLGQFEKDNYTIHTSFSEKLCWPLDTIMRFHYFCKNVELMKNFDYIFYLDSDMAIHDEIKKEEIIPYEKGLVGVLHPGFYKDKKGTFDRNPASNAYVSKKHTNPYFQGCVIGGTAEKFVGLIQNLKHAVEADFKNNYIALWHDESHLNKYFADNPPMVLHPGFAYPEGWNIPFDMKIIHLAKNHSEIRK
jgi:hypothetical protein